MDNREVNFLIPKKRITKKTFLEIFPFFQRGSPEAAKEILSAAMYEALPANTQVILVAYSKTKFTE